MCTPSSQPPSLLSLPLEIRLLIYEHLLLPSYAPSPSHSTSLTNLFPDYHTYQATPKPSPFTLAIRTINPYLDTPASTRRKRTTYRVRNGPFLTSTTPTTYRVLLSPHTAHLRHTIPSLLPLNRQIHAEAAKVLYATYTFDFHTSIEAAVPFLSDLTPAARAAIRSLALTKKGLPHTKEFDRAEWAALCKFLGAELRLWTLHLNVVAGKPGADGWAQVRPISADEFAAMRGKKGDVAEGEAEGAELEWVQELFAVRGLRGVSVRALVEQCPGPVSEAMAFWIRVSASVEGGFAEWVRRGVAG